jgi:hypothetical protein
MPKEEGFGKQTQVMFRRGWSADDVTAKAYPVSTKLEVLLRRYSWKKVLQKYSRISYGLDGRRMSRNHEVILKSGPVADIMGNISNCSRNRNALILYVYL